MEREIGRWRARGRERKKVDGQRESKGDKDGE